jgi:APA family basic amino acid/polyamine antiporter
MRVKHPQVLRPYRVWGYPWVPALHLLGSLAIFIDLLMVKTRYSVFGLVIVSGAIPIYLWRRRKNAKMEVAEVDEIGSALALGPVFSHQPRV